MVSSTCAVVCSCNRHPRSVYKVVSDWIDGMCNGAEKHYKK